MEDNDRVLLMACKRYNAPALIEAGTGDTINNFKKWNAKEYLLKDPTVYINRSINPGIVATYGIMIGDGETKLDGLRMLKDFLYEPLYKKDDGTNYYRLHEIYSPSFLKELQNFNLKGNFDRISDAIVAMYEFKKDALKYEKNLSKAKSNTSNSSLFNILNNND